MLPQFVIIGTQKSASSFLHLCLADHPAIFMPAGETPFFESPDYEQSSIDELERLFVGHEDRLCGIRRPSYLGRPEVPARLKEHLPQAKLLVVLRNPVQRVISAYYHYMGTGFIPVRPIGRGLRAILQGDYERRYRRSREILEFGLYAQHLSAYLERYERRAICIHLHEDIVRDPALAMKAVYAFLGVDDRFESSQLRKRPQASIYSIPRLWVKQWFNPIAYTYNADRTRLWKRPPSPLRTRIHQLYLLLDRGILDRLFPSVAPSLDDELTEQLRAYYRNDVCRLEQLLDRNLSSWK